MDNKGIFESLDPELIQRMVSRREAFRKFGISLAATSVPSAFGLLARDAFGQALSQEIIDVLNFALTLEYLEDEFYRTALATEEFIDEPYRTVFQVISEHESAHVALLKSVLGGNAVAKPTFDFTAGGQFNPFVSRGDFFTLSQAFEDTGVRAYKGQAGNLITNNEILTTALQIHSVEARHAQMVRVIREEQPWIEFDDTNEESIAAVYEGENNLIQAGVDVTTVTSVSAEKITEAFDEPLTKEQVLAIVDPFIVD